MTLPGAAGAAVQTDPLVIEQIEIQAKYQGYIDRQQDEVAAQSGARGNGAAGGLDYATVPGLSKEVQQKLKQHQPQTLGQASRIQGITPAAISLLMVHLKRLGAPRDKKTA